MVEHLSKILCKDRVRLLSASTGEVHCGLRHRPEDVEVQQGRPRLLLPAPALLDLAEWGMEGEAGVPVTVGNPHLVIFLKNRYIPQLLHYIRC